MNLLNYNTFRILNAVFLFVTSLYAFGWLKKLLDAYLVGSVTIIFVIGFYGFYLARRFWLLSTSDFEKLRTSGYAILISLYSIGLFRQQMDWQGAGTITPITLLGIYGLYLAYNVWQNR